VTGIPAGWYPDPWHPTVKGLMRWWDGARWSHWTNIQQVSYAAHARLDRLHNSELSLAKARFKAQRNYALARRKKTAKRWRRREFGAAVLRFF
jgi:hypothetical protein